jgi:hypothetical protein
MQFTKKAHNKIFQQTLQIVTTDYRVCHAGESGSHGREEFIFSACFISLHPLKISFLRHPAALLRIPLCACLPLALLILSANIKPQVGGKAGKKQGVLCSLQAKTKAHSVSRLIYLCVIIMSISVPPLSQIFIYIRERLGVDKSQRLVQFSRRQIDCAVIRHGR